MASLVWDWLVLDSDDDTQYTSAARPTICHHYPRKSPIIITTIISPHQDDYFLKEHVKQAKHLKFFPGWLLSWRGLCCWKCQCHHMLNVWRHFCRWLRAKKWQYILLQSSWSLEKQNVSCSHHGLRKKHGRQHGASCVFSEDSLRWSTKMNSSGPVPFNKENLFWCAFLVFISLAPLPTLKFPWHMNHKVQNR